MLTPSRVKVEGVFPEKGPLSTTPCKRIRAKVSKATRRQASDAAEARQPQKARNFKSSKNQDFNESPLRISPSSIAPEISRNIISSLPQIASQEHEGMGQHADFDETCNTYPKIQGSFWPVGVSPDQSVDEFIPRDCFEATSLTAATQADGHQKYLETEAKWQTAPAGLTDNFSQVCLHKYGQEGRSPSACSDYFPEDFLGLEHKHARSFNDDGPFDILINDLPGSENPSLLWGDDDEYSMAEYDDAGIMQLEELEKVMTAAESSAIGERLDAAKALPSLSTDNDRMTEPNADHHWEVEDLFVESLQAGCNDCEPQEGRTENRSFAFSSPQPAPRSPPSSQFLDPVGEDRSESLYDDEDLERELLNLGTSAFSNLDGSLSTTPPSSPVAVSSSSILPLKEPMPQPCTPLPGIPHVVSFDADGKPLPFIRAPFVKPVRDRPVIHALRSQTVLRTCFRIGEALNAGCTAASSNIDAVIELYARVSSSTREPGTYKQRFQFADLFTPDKPPFLTGAYTLWRGVELWDRGSRVFLGEAGKGRMARVVSRMRKEEGSWTMAILCIWQVDWEEVGLAKGIVCS